MLSKTQWESVWRRLDEWVTNYPIKECSACAARDHTEPAWEQQQAKIEELVGELV